MNRAEIAHAPRWGLKHADDWMRTAGVPVEFRDRAHAEQFAAGLRIPQGWTAEQLPEPTT